MPRHWAKTDVAKLPGMCRFPPRFLAPGLWLLLAAAAAQPSLAQTAEVGGANSVQRMDDEPLPENERAPLLLFGAGSLVVGGILFGIEATSSNRNDIQVLGKNSDVNFAILMAGLSAATAGWSYFHFGHGRASAVAAVIPAANRSVYTAEFRLRFSPPGG